MQLKRVLGADREAPLDRLVDGLIVGLLERLEPDHLNDPRFALAMLRDAFRPYRKRVRGIVDRGDPSGPTDARRRFERLLATIETSLPPLPAAVALSLVREADRFLGCAVELPESDLDVASHFRMSSSFGRKARLLWAIVRSLHPLCCLEAGTAYGMGSLVILSALESQGPEGMLSTVEAQPAIAALAFESLRARFGGRVRGWLGLSEKLLPEMAAELGGVDFFFHDACHSGEAYVGDFAAVADWLSPGAAVLFDDIRWSGAGSATASRCEAGWKEVASHPRVRLAAEIGSNLGLLLVD